uniref:Tc toxin subunit A-related protein n=1 Tax=Herbidospora sakaeratensis TaxID=564415 RepID=UPI0007812E43|nr:hemopexin repeat-containing protein [Herbidospora sakaeratensis]
MPNYELLFGELDFRTGDEGRSVTSPAAYLADLLRLLDEQVGEGVLSDRRPDIARIPLDSEHTFTETPYLDIVVEILEQLVGADPYEDLRTRAHPFDKPFNLAFDELREHLRRRGVGKDEVVRPFTGDAAAICREFLGLAPEAAEVIFVARPDALRDQLGLEPGEVLDDDRFVRAAALSDLEVEQLGVSSFVRRGQDGWMERANRFVRLARRLELPFPDLDLVLVSCCDNRLDADALPVLAAVVHLARTFTLPITVSLAAPVDDPAALDGVAPAELARIRERLREVDPQGGDDRAVRRAARYLAALGLSADELFDLLRVVEASFPVPFALTRRVGDGRRVLAGPGVREGLWLAQALPPLVVWIRATGLSAADLAAFAGGPSAAAVPPLEAGVEVPATVFASARFSERASRALKDLLDAGASPYEALVRMGEVTAADFPGIGAALAGKIFTNLVLRRHLTAEGDLVHVPRELATDFSGYQDKVTELLQRAAVYPSDLGGLPGLTENQRAELYDNLVFAGVIGRDGVVADPLGRVTCDLTAVERPVVDLLRARQQAFESGPIPAVFPDDVLESLRINGYVDAAGNHTRKKATLADFALGAEFDHDRREIFDTLQAQRAAFRERTCRFTPEDFAFAADPVALAGLADPVLPEVEWEQRPYRLDLEAIAALGFTGEESDALVALLTGRGDLDGRLAVPADRLAFFVRPHNVLAFDLPGLDDYAAEVFALLGAVAVEISAGTAEIEATLAAVESARRDALAQAAEAEFGPLAPAICDGMGVDVAALADPAEGLLRRRVKAFALFAGKLGMGPDLVVAVFRDLALTGRHPEPFALPDGVTRIDALLESSDGHVHVFSGGTCWRYSSATRALVDSRPLPGGLTRVDAAFTRPDGGEWLVEGARTLVRAKGGQRWVPGTRTWGAIRNDFTTGAVEAAHVDDDGRTYLFSGDQYVRYSSTDFSRVDEGFPRPAEEFGELPETSFDGSPDLPEGPPDTVYSDETGVYALIGRMVVKHGQSLEQRDAYADDGYPVLIADHFPGVPAEFEIGVDAAFRDDDGVTHLFKDGRTVALDGTAQVVATTGRWGVHTPLTKVDAAFVGLDGFTYLFGGEDYVRYSGSDYTRADLGYPRPIAPDWGGLTRVGAAFTLDGKTHLFGDRYVRFSTADYRTPDTDPPPFTWWNLPDGFGVDAVFTDPRGRTHLLGGGGQRVHFDGRERWWSAPEPLWDSLPFQQVDAAFTGRDGRVYVFSADRYVRYSGDFSQVDDGYPASVPNFWGRTPDLLTRTGRVDAALNHDGHVYLFSGDQFRRYTGGAADPGYPRPLAEFAPEVPLTRVDAVYASGGDLFLVDGSTTHVISRELYRVRDTPGVTCAFVEDGRLVTEGPAGWSSRPRVLAGVPEKFRTGLDAVLDGAYLFKGAACYDTRVDQEFPVTESWGLAPEPGVVDAGYVKDGRTVLFSGPMFTDGGAPQPIAARFGLDSVMIAYVHDKLTHLFEHPAADGTMRHLVVETGENDVADASYWGAGHIPRAVVAREDTLVLLDGDTYTLPGDGTRRPAGLLWRGFEGELTTVVGDRFYFGERYRDYRDGGFGPLTEPRPTGIATVDAAFVWDGAAYLFSGDRYVRYSTGDHTAADPGYPKPIAGELRREEPFRNLPESFDDALTTIDAVHADLRTVTVVMGGRSHVVATEAVAAYEDLAGAVRPLGDVVDAELVVGDRTYLLSGRWYSRRTGQGEHADPGYPRDIADLAGDLGVPAFPDAFLDGVDAGFAGAGGIHLFKGRTHLRADAPDTGSPAWGHVDSRFDGGLDAAFTGEDGELYVFRAGQYARYSGADLTWADPGYPRTVQDDWGDLPADYEEGVDGAFTLRGKTYLTRGEEYVRLGDPGFPRVVAEAWADAADYRLGDLHTIARFTVLDHATGGALTTALTEPDSDPYRTMAALFGWDPAELMWAERTLRAPSAVEFVLKAAEVFSLARRVGVAPSALPALRGERDNAVRRDALLTAVGEPGELFERLLLDVEMGGQGTTSRVREAIAAVQLYVHRLLLDLEPASEETRERLRRWWTWMRNYRVWEANRKVFLYPENYLRPELRDTKTPAFRELENDLLRSGVTSATAQRAYKRYLDEYTEVSRLEITGGYVDESADGARDLVLFGRTRTEPRRHYYRYATFRDGEKTSAAWGPWLKADVRMDAARVHPVRAFDRVFAFWATVETVPPDRPDTATIVTSQQSETTQTVSAPAAAARCVKIYYSFCNLNQEWVPAQLLATGAPRTDTIGEVTLTVRTGTLPDSDHAAIRVSYTAVTGAGVVGAAFALAPELYTVELDEVTAPPPIAGDVTEIFDEPQRLDPASVVWFNRPVGFTDGAWFSLDHKGGSVLCRPIMPAPDETVALPLRGNSESLPSWDRVHTGFELYGLRYLFDNTDDGNGNGGRFVTIRNGNSRGGAPQLISSRWGRVRPPAGPAPGVVTATIGTPVVLPTAIPLTGPALPGGHNPLAQGDGGSDDGGVVIPPVVAPPATGWTSVDAAWITNRVLYLTSGTTIGAYTLSASGELDEYMDAGYPREIPRPIKGVFWQYAFTGDHYTKIFDWDFKPVEGDWDGLPERLTGAMETPDGLYLFIEGDPGADGTGPGQYLFTPAGAAVQRPYRLGTLKHEIVRLTTSTAYKLNQRLLAGGVAALLDTATQETDELPAFDTRTSDSTTIRVREERVVEELLPGRSHLDFHSANGVYYWEIFFHAPLLIAQALNTAQRFDEARTWYEYVFDPTRADQYWRFLPFLAADPGALAETLRDQGAPGEVITLLESLVPVFQGLQPLTAQQRRDLQALEALPPSEDLAVAMELDRQYDLTGDRVSLLAAYREDPFDPHTIAALRPVAYRRAVVMAYVDNLLDWGDTLFRRHTMESVDEARMLYILAWDLLGRRPDQPGTIPAGEAATFETLPALPSGHDLMTGPHAGVADPYFHVPANTALSGYWDLVADRLTKIRASLDIMGVSGALPLFEPPVEPSALVRGAALAGGAAPAGAPPAEVPHQRFSVTVKRAQDLAERVRDLGGRLLDVLEKRDGEALALLRDRQEGAVLELTQGVKEAQVAAAAANLRALQASLAAAEDRVAYWEGVVADGLSALQEAQLAMMGSASASHAVAAGLKIGASFAFGMPEVLIGPFIFGTSFGGDDMGEALESAAGIAESSAESLSVMGELLGVRAEHERAEADWRFQRTSAEADVTELGHQVGAGQAQLLAAQRELDLHLAESAGQAAVSAFLAGRFAGHELYQWMSGRMTELYFQAYGLAYEMARAAEKACQFERGTDVTVIRPTYWDGLRGGLLAGEALLADLDALVAVHARADRRRLEITRRVSLLEHDPIALLTLRESGTCELGLPEDLFDRDFPGHYLRQIRSVAVAFHDGEGSPIEVNATLTQLAHKTVTAADPKAVQYLLDPKGAAPANLRVDWRPSQRIALSHVPEGAENNGLHEMRYDDDRYLPFEGTGAVGAWRLELPGLRGRDLPGDLADVQITLRYTAEHGGDAFASTVRGLLQPAPAAMYFDVPGEFPDEWESLGTDLVLPLTSADLPDLAAPMITGLYAVYDGEARLSLGDLALPHGRLVPTPGLVLTGGGLRLTLTGDRTALEGLGLVVTYRAGTR